MKHYEVKLRIDTTTGTSADDLKNWLTCLGPAATVLDVRLVGESVIQPDATGRQGDAAKRLTCSKCEYKPRISGRACVGRGSVHGNQFSCALYREKAKPGEESHD